MHVIKTPQQIRKELSRSGKTVVDLAKDINHLGDYHLVYALVSGRNKGVRGKSFTIAQKLGLKELA